ncbi:SRPBCC domain-containing protein [Catellatospora coxensis]
MAGDHRPGLHQPVLAGHLRHRLAGRLDDDLGAARRGHGRPGAGRAGGRPYRRLAYTFHTFTPEFAKSVDMDEELRQQLAAEQRSKVSFDLEPVGDLVKLTVVHDGFAPGSALPGMVSQGWPHLLSDLKTLLETGRTMAE